MNKYFSLFLIIIIFVALVVLGFLICERYKLYNINNWRSYLNNTYGFELKYPSGFIVSSQGPNSIKESIDKGEQLLGTQKFSYDTIVFSNTIGDLAKIGIFDEYEKDLTPENYANSLYLYGPCDLRSGFVPETIKQSSINGIKVLKAKGKNLYNLSSTCYYLKNLNNNLIVVSSGEYETLFNKMLSTFNLLKIAEEINWNIYKNTEYGIEFNYPQNYSHQEESKGIIGFYQDGYQGSPDMFFSVSSKEPITLLFQGTWSPVLYSQASSSQLFSSEEVSINGISFKKDYWLIRSAGEDQWFTAISFNTLWRGKYYSVCWGIVIKDPNLPQAPYSGDNIKEETLLNSALDRMKETDEKIIFDKMMSTFKFDIKTGEMDIDYNEIERVQKSVDEDHQF